MSKSKFILLTLTPLILIGCSLTNSIVEKNRKEAIMFEENFFDTQTFSSSTVDNLRLTSLKNSIKIKYNYLEDAQSYIIERMDNVDNQWHTLEQVKDSSFIDNSVEPNKLYYYRVRAVNLDKGLYSKYSEIKSSQLYTSVTNLKATQGSLNGKIRISWTNNINIKKYEIILRSNGDCKTINTTENSYEYKTNKEDFYHIVVKTIYKNGIIKKSNSVLGYILISEAPDSPQDFNASKNGISIELNWNKSSNSKVCYKLSRIDNKNRNILLDDNIKTNKYIDDIDLNEGVTYEYVLNSYIEKNDKKLFSQPTSTYGSILSSPINLKLKKENNDSILVGNSICDDIDDAYYLLSNIKELGSVDYTIYDSTNKIKEYKDIILPVHDINYVFKDKTIISLDVQLIKGNYKTNKVSVKMNNSFDNISTNPFTNIICSKNTVPENGEANIYGFYPITITYSRVNDAVKYIVYKSESGKNDFSVISVTKDNFILDTESDTMGIKYDYAVRAMNEIGQVSKSSCIVTGYAAVTDELFLRTVDKYVSHYWFYKKDSEIFKKVEKAGLGSLGQAILKGDICGQLNYYAKIYGIGGLITFTYEDYQTLPWLVANGYYQIYSNIIQNGSLSGTLIISGMYPGSINNDNIILDNSVVKGYLIVTQDNGTNISSHQPPVDYEEDNI